MVEDLHLIELSQQNQFDQKIKIDQSKVVLIFFFF